MKNTVKMKDTVKNTIFERLLGDKGRGKTTHLLSLRAARPAPYVHLPEDGPLESEFFFHLLANKP